MSDAVSDQCCHLTRKLATTADPVTAEPTATIGELARDMLNARIHRLIVVDAEGRPIGIVSSMDILAAVAFEAAVD